MGLSSAVSDRMLLCVCVCVTAEFMACSLSLGLSHFLPLCLSMHPSLSDACQSASSPPSPLSRLSISVSLAPKHTWFPPLSRSLRLIGG